MTCSNIPPMLSRYLDREMSPPQTAEVEGHLARCESCRALLRDWRLQGSHLRAHLGRHALGESFVRRVMESASEQAQETFRPEARRLQKRDLLRWLPAAAAILVVVFLAGEFFTYRDGTGAARVIDPGESLEVLSNNSGVWVRGAAGALLRSGDWLRNPVPGEAEILWRDGCRFTLEPGTIAHISGISAHDPDQLVLMKGSVTAETAKENADIQVRTPVGSISGGGGSYAVRILDFAMGRMELSAGGSEVLIGTVVPAGELTVMGGTAKILTAQGTREMPAGEKAAFTGEGFARLAPRPDSARAALKIWPGSSEAGTLCLSLNATENGLRADLTATNVSLKRLLEYATGIDVRGGENLSVSGDLYFSPDSDPQSIASAVAFALELPISYRQGKTQRMLTAKGQPPRPAPDWTRGDYRLETSSEGLISFNFNAVPAGRVIQLLRSAVPDLPPLAEDAVWIPVTLQASGLSPAVAADYVKRAIGLEVDARALSPGFLQIDAPANLPNAGTGSGGASHDATHRVSQEAGDKIAVAPGSPGDRAAEAEESSSAATTATNAVEKSEAQLPGGLRTLWSVLNGASAVPVMHGGLTGVGAGQSVTKGKASSKTPEFFAPRGLIPDPVATTHLVWPALSIEEASGGEADYLVTNALGLAVRTLWHGFDRDGRLVARYSLLINGYSTFAVYPPRDLPTSLGEGGHWETISDKPLIGFREGGSGGSAALGLPVEAERVRAHWTFPAAWLNLGGRLWLVNPGSEPATITATILRQGRTISTGMLIIPAHGGALVPGSSFAIGNLPANLASGAALVIHSLSGPVASGFGR